MSLAPCRSCSRHIRTSGRECPFCGGPAVVDAVPVRSFAGLSRAMLFFGGSVAIATSLEACGGEALPAPAPVEGAQTNTADGGAPVTAATAPAKTATATPATTAASSVDAGTPAPPHAAAAPLGSATALDLSAAAGLGVGVGSGTHVPLAGTSGYGGPPPYNRDGTGGPKTAPPKAPKK